MVLQPSLGMLLHHVWLTMSLWQHPNRSVPCAMRILVVLSDALECCSRSKCHRIFKLTQFLNLFDFWRMAPVHGQKPHLTNDAPGLLLFPGPWVSQSLDALPSTCTYLMPPPAILWGLMMPLHARYPTSPFSLARRCGLYSSNMQTTESQGSFWECVSWGTFQECKFRRI